MSEILSLFLLGLVIAAVAALLWWLLIASEGVYLGRRVVIWLYDLYAHRYDGVKQYYPEYEQRHLAKPLMAQLWPLRSPLVLDVATGTARLPLALARHQGFDGQVIGADLSRRMLRFAAKNISPYVDRISLLWCPAEDLPFADDTFDAVTCLEALEFMTNPQAALKELTRVLRPGGTLLITQRKNTKFMPGKIWTSGEIQGILENLGVEAMKGQIWQVDYHKVWGRKHGSSPPTNAQPLETVLRCLRCREHLMKPQGREWVCEGCGGRAKVGSDGVIELFALYR